MTSILSSDMSTSDSNEYWNAVCDLVQDRTIGVEIDARANAQSYVNRAHDVVTRRNVLVKKYSWTITDPDSVKFVAHHSGGKLIDPLAGTGWWAKVLQPFGVDTVSYDISPPDQNNNPWHLDVRSHVPIVYGEAKHTPALHCDRTMLLSWPPYESDGYSDAGLQAILAYTGNQIIYIGESEGGCCGTDAMFQVLANEWRIVDEAAPVTWWGVHDYITVYERQL